MKIRGVMKWIVVATWIVARPAWPADAALPSSAEPAPSAAPSASAAPVAPPAPATDSPPPVESAGAPAPVATVVLPTPPPVAAAPVAVEAPSAPITPPPAAPVTPAPDAAEVAALGPGIHFSLELAAGIAAGARFPSNTPGRSVNEVADGSFGLSGWFGSTRSSIGIALDHTGLGKDLYETTAAGSTLGATYVVDSLSLAGRWYFSEARPAVYLSAYGGPALPSVRATGTRAGTDGIFVTPPAPFSCSAFGHIGATAGLAAGVEFAVANTWTVTSELRANGYFTSSSATQFGGCAPGPGPGVSGALRLGVAHRF